MYKQKIAYAVSLGWMVLEFYRILEARSSWPNRRAIIGHSCHHGDGSFLMQGSSSSAKGLRAHTLRLSDFVSDNVSATCTCHILTLSGRCETAGF